VKYSYQSKKRAARISAQLYLPHDYPWKVLSSLVSDLRDYLSESGNAELVQICRNRDVPSYLALSERWGLQSITTLDTNRSKISAMYQIASLLKKYQFPGDKEARRSVALEKFDSAERTCLEFNQGGYTALSCSDLLETQSVFTYARGFFIKLLGDMPELQKVVDWSRHGPGATLSTRDGHTSKYHKYLEWPYDCTVGALAHARFLISSDERWMGALEDDYRRVMEIPAWKILDRECFWKNVLSQVGGNRITFVPKTAVTDRSIAIEPAMNLMLQLGVDGFIRKRLKRFGVDLDDQSKNQELARQGSLDDGPESFCTLDLSSASDTVSLKLIELLLPPMWYDYLVDLRSPKGEIEGRDLVYSKISSMGNGYTFALESAVFTSIIYGVMRLRWGSFYKGRCAIFGDDLIVPKSIVHDVVNYLALSGFKTNLEKTFLQGPIRESCGTDWLLGHQIRPVFFNEIPTTTKALFVDRNRLMRKLEMEWEIEDSETVRLIDQWVPDKHRIFTGPLSHTDFDSYLHVRRPTVAYAFGRYEYLRLITKPKPQSGRSFLFRKLMAELRGGRSHPFNEKAVDIFIMKMINPNFMKEDVSRRYIKDLAASGGGSKFTVTRRNKVTVGVEKALTSSWWGSYDAIFP